MNQSSVIPILRFHQNMNFRVSTMHGVFGQFRITLDDTIIRIFLRALVSGHGIGIRFGGCTVTVGSSDRTAANPESASSDSWHELSLDDKKLMTQPSA